MKKAIFADFFEYNDPINKLGNYHYANCFAKDNYEVLWISNLFNELIYLKDKEDYKFKKSISTSNRHRLEENIYGFAPYSRRLYGNYAFSRSANIALNNEKYIIPNIRNSLNKIGFDDVEILWISNPKHYWLTNVVKYNKLVYRIPDDFTHFKAFPSSVGEVENRLIDKADYVFITSKLLENKVLARNKKPYLLNNGVNFKLFNSSNSERPIEYGQDKKTIVYVGAIEYWMNIELIKKMANEVEADIYIIGKAGGDIRNLKNLPNVHIIGPRPYETIPAYLKHSDVAIIPFEKNELTDAISPIKLYEYCSAGVAVVSSDLEEVRNTNAPIYIANNDEDFISGVNYYLNNNYDSNNIINFGRENSWDSRYLYIKSII